MEGTRLRILQVLQKNGNETVDGLAATIGLAPATIRRHLDILQRDRLVAYREVRKPTGRPEFSYYLSEDGQEALPKGYARLLSMVVGGLSNLSANDTASKSGGQILDMVFERASNQAYASLEVEMSGKNLDQRLPRLLEHLQREDFSPAASINGDTLSITLQNCPYRAIALQNETVCSYDHNFIGRMLELELSKQGGIHTGDTGCTYTADVGTAAPKSART